MNSVHCRLKLFYNLKLILTFILTCASLYIHFRRRKTEICTLVQFINIFGFSATAITEPFGHLSIHSDSNACKTQLLLSISEIFKAIIY